RHTRSYGDWSSDVCSSDLQQLGRDVDLTFFELFDEGVGAVGKRCAPGKVALFAVAAAVEVAADAAEGQADHDAGGHDVHAGEEEIGRASCRERVWSAVWDG